MDKTRKGLQAGPAPPLHLDPGLLVLVEPGNHPPIAQIGQDLPDLFQIAFLIVKNEFMPEEALEKGVVVTHPIDRDHILRTRQDGGRHEAHREKVVEDVVLVILQVHPLVVLEGIDDLLDLFLLLFFRPHAGDEPRLIEEGQGLADRILPIGEGHGQGDLAGSEVVVKQLQDFSEFTERDPPSVVTEEAHGRERKGGDHRHLVDRPDDCVADPAVEALPLVDRHLLQGLLLGGEVGFQQERFPDIHVDTAVPPPEQLAALDHLRRPLLLLGGAAELLEIGLLFNDPVISDIDGDRGQIINGLFQIGLDDHGEESVLGHDHLPRPASPAFDEEFQGQPFFQEHLDVLGKNLGIEVVSLEAPPEEERTRFPEDVSHGEERKVRSGRDERHLDVVLVEDVGKQEIIEMAAVAGDDDKGHLLGDVPDLRYPLDVDHDTVVYVVPEPVEHLVPDLDEYLIVIGGDLIQIFYRLLPDGVKIPLGFFRLCRRLFHVAHQPSVPEDHTDDLLPGFQKRPDDRRLFIIDPGYQLPAELPDELFPGECIAGAHELGKVDRFGGDQGSLVGIPEEGDDPPQRVRRIALAEEDVDQAFLFLLSSAPVGYQLGTEIDRHVQGRLHLHQFGEGLLHEGVFKELGLPEMDDGALPVTNKLFEILRLRGIA